MMAVLAMTACAPTTDYPEITDELAEGEARKQRLAVLEESIRTEKRLSRVSYPILLHNAELCGEETTYRIGVSTWTADQMDSDYRYIAEQEFNVGEILTVVGTAPGSPAERADIRAGDRIASINGETLSEGQDGMEDLVEALDESNGEMVRLDIVRDGQARSVAVQPDRVCAYPVLWSRSDKVNAFADGNSIYVTTGFLRFVENDDELAAVLGHELAHNTRGHVDAKRGNVLIGTLLGALVSAAIGGVVHNDAMQLGQDIGARAYSQAFEAEADYVGVYHAVRAGYDVRNAMAFWRRMAAENPEAIHLAGSTHPSTAKRFLAMEKAIDEVEDKRERGLPLVPNETKPDPDAAN